MENGEIIIIAYKGEGLDVIVPDTMFGKPVVKIDYYAFSLFKDRIKKDVKERLTKLTSVYIGSNVTSIGKYVFKGCESLDNIVFPESFAEISEKCFQIVPVLQILKILKWELLRVLVIVRSRNAQAPQA